MSTPNKDIGKVEVRIKWDPSPHGEPDIDLDIIAATYRAEEPYGSPAYLVHFDSRSPDGTITLNRDSRTAAPRTWSTSTAARRTGPSP